MNAPRLHKIDVDTLFGLARPTVQSAAGKGIQADLALLQTLESGQQASPFSVEDIAHIQQVSDSYLQHHPLGFLAKSSPIIAQSMVQDALRRDVAKLTGAYNFANGHFKNLDAAIDSLRHKSSDEFAPAVQSTFNAIHREVIHKTAKEMADMVRSVRDDLWGTSARDEREMQQQFEYTAKQLDNALALFDQGRTEEAMALYADAMGETEGYASWFGRALSTSEHRKFIAHVGIAMAAGAAAYFSGGASLALMGGAKASLAANGTAMLIGGAGMTITSRGLNSAIFNKTFFIPGTTMDKAVDFGGELLHNTALMGFLKLGNIAGKAIPMMEGEPIVAATVNAARSFAIEFGSFTGFNMVSSIAHEFDDRQPSIDDVLSKEALIENAAFILGLRVGHLSLNGAKFMTRQGLNALKAANVRIQERLNTPQMARLLLSPLAIIGGIPGGGGIAGPALTNDLPTLLRTRGIQSAAIEVYNRRPYKFWGIMNLLDLGVPPALVAYRILRLQVDDYSRALMKEFQGLLDEPAVKEALVQIRAQGMRAYLASNGVRMDSDKFRSGAEFMDRLAVAFTQMQGYINRFFAAATEAGHMVGMEYEGRTHLGAYEEVVWPDDEAFTPRDKTTGPSVRDRMAITLKDDLTEKGYEVEFVPGKPHFGYTASPIVFPTIFERYKVDGTVVKVEILTGTGAVIVSVVSESNPNKAKTEHVKGAKTVFEPEVETTVAKMVAEALQLNTDGGSPEDTIDILRRNKNGYDRRYLIQAKAADNDILKIWVNFNDNNTATLDPINGVLCNEKGDYVPGTITVPAKSYEDVQDWVIKRAAGNSVFAQKSDQYEGVLIKGFGVVTLTDEAHPYKELVSPKLKAENFTTWLDVVNSLGNMGITGTTPYNLVGTHVHGNLPMTMDPAGSIYTVQPVLGILRAFVEDGNMLYDAIPSHDNRLGFIQRLPAWFRERLLDPTYVTDPTDRRQILRVAADLARDVKKYNAMNLSNHISAFLAKMIEKGIFQDGESETISSEWNGEKYNFRVSAGALPEGHDIIREIDCADFTISTLANHKPFSITGRNIAESYVHPRKTDFFRSTVYQMGEEGSYTRLQVGRSHQRTLKYQGDEYQFIAIRTTHDSVTVEVKQQVHLMRVAKDARKTTAEIRIPDAIFDSDTGRFFLDFYYAWSWWHGTGQFLNSTPTSQVPGFVQSGATFMSPPATRAETQSFVTGGDPFGGH